MTKEEAKLKIKENFNKVKDWRFSTSYIAKMAILTALSFVLYAFCKFNIPVLFPSFLEIQFSEVPALLAGFSMGPISGCLIIIFKCLLKLPLSSTAFAGELTDILLGITFVLPASLIYKFHKQRKFALIGLGVSILLVTVMSVIMNRFVSIPIYLNLFFSGSWDPLLGMLRPLYESITIDNFYTWYLGVGVVPFNLFRCILVSFATFLLYKSLSKVLHWEGRSILKKGISQTIIAKNLEETDEIAKKITKSLQGGEIILLGGDLGAGKTTLTKSIAKYLEIEEEVTSPTFTIMNVYESGNLKLNHLDMYRIEREEDLVELGIEESIFDTDSVTVIEWNKFTHLTGRIINVKIKLIEDGSREFQILDSKDDKKKVKKSK